MDILKAWTSELGLYKAPIYKWTENEVYLITGIQNVKWSVIYVRITLQYFIC